MLTRFTRFFPSRPSPPFTHSNSQLNVYLIAGDTYLRTARGDEEWNGAKFKRAGQRPDNCAGISEDLNSLRAWVDKKSSGWSEQGLWHLLTECYQPGGTIGLAYVGVLCRGGYGTGVNHASGATAWKTVAHEIGHNFNGAHSFENGQGSTGGIMDYGDGKVNGVYQFNTKYRKTEMCEEVNKHVSSCKHFSSFAPACGNGLLEAGEECECPGGVSSCTCCTKCRLATSATCAMGDCCNTDTCQYKSTGISCGPTKMGNGDVGFCSGLSNECNKKCSAYGADYCGVQTNTCKFKCSGGRVGLCKDVTYSNRPTFHDFPTGSGCAMSDGSQGLCDFGTCVKSLNTEFSWIQGTFGQCSKTCGEGTKTRSVICQSSAGGGGGGGVRRLAECVDDNASCPSWASGGECTRNPGYMHVNCKKSCSICSAGVSGGGSSARSAPVTVPDASCASAGSKPATSLSCNLASCGTYTWMTAAEATYEDCSTNCGDGTQARTGSACKVSYASGKGGRTVDNGLCTQFATNKQPVIRKACNTGNCPAQWASSPFGECSKQCGGGEKTRTVECYQSKDAEPTKVANSVCTGQGAKDMNLVFGGVTYTSFGSSFGPTSASLTNKRVVKVASDACDFNAISETLTGKVALINRGGACSFADKVKMAQNKGAIAVIMANNVATALYTLPGANPQITIPTRFVSQADGVGIAAAISRNTVFALSGSKGTPDNTQNCNTAACATYSWTPGAYGTCSTTCGAGTNTRAVLCKSNTGTTVADSQCTGTKPSTTGSCSTNACPVPINFVWVAETWSACSKTCASGKQTRRVKCRDTFNTDADALGKIQTTWKCTSQRPRLTKPATSKVCSFDACPVYEYQTDSWGVCSKTCRDAVGSGSQGRTVKCMETTKNKEVSDSLCTAASKNKPSTTQTCNTRSCPTQYEWNKGSFGACSTTCGDGSQTRTVKCRARVSKRAASDYTCRSEGSKPATTESCSNAPCTTYAWITTPAATFGTCSVTCGGGTQLRIGSACQSTQGTTVTAVDDSLCTSATNVEPSKTKPCNLQACVAYEWTDDATWGACSTTCGDGQQTRTVGCRETVSKNAAADGKCSTSGTKPAVEQACSNAACTTYAWVAPASAAYGTCSVTCGGGTQLRIGSACQSTQGTTVKAVDDSLCTSATNTEPAKSKACNAEVCITYEWTEEAWNACSKTCGDGTQARRVVCRETVSKNTESDYKCAGTKPDVVQACSNAACITYAWVTAASAQYGACTTSCGGGTQSRIGNSCKSTQGALVAAVADSFCTAGATNAMPSMKKSCNLQVCLTRWSSGTFGDCDKQCGTGKRVRPVDCEEKKDGRYTVVADESKCNNAKPDVSEICNTAACPSYSWITGTYGTCDKTCGTGVATRTVTCSQSGQGTVDDSKCTKGKPAVSTQCIKPDCTDYKWVSEAYGAACAGDCGTGIQTRVVACRNVLDTMADTKGTIVDEAFCTNPTIDSTLTREQKAALMAASYKPDVEKVCVLDACPVYKFIFGTWGTCNKACGGGSRTRTVACKETTKNVAATDKDCTDGGLTKPGDTEPCNTALCPDYNFVTEPYGKCSVDCGTGVQDRVVTCRDTTVTSVDSKGSVVADSFCSSLIKPVVSQGCVKDACPVYKFVLGTWSKCDAACDGGTRTRTVACKETTKNVAATSKECTDRGLTQMPASEACNTDLCPDYNFVTEPYGKCSVACGTGVQDRAVTCRDTTVTSVDSKGSVVADSFCSSLIKPVVSQGCVKDACPVYKFVLGIWGVCSKSCEGGSQARTVACTEMTKGVAATDTDCLDRGLTKSATSQACSTAPCPISYVWTTDTWGACSKTCGAGVQARGVSCINSKTGEKNSNTALCAGSKPDESKSCVHSGSPCTTYTWVLPADATYSACSTDCGGGKQTRTGNSCSAVTGTFTVKVADTFCMAATNAEPATEKVCGTSKCPTQFTAGAWSQCSVECGGGTHTRSVKCEKTKDQIVSEVAMTQCAAAGNGEVTFKAGADNKVFASMGANFGPQVVSVIGVALVPVLGDACTSIVEELTSKVAVIDRGGGCSFSSKVKMAQDKGALAVVIVNNADSAVFTLGGTDATIKIHTRFVSKSDGWILKDLALDAATAMSTIGSGQPGAVPVNSEACNTAACATYHWVKGTWGQCSKSCGTGSRARRIQCMDDAGTKQTDETKCTGAKPEAKGTCAAAQACPEDPATSKHAWIAEAFGACSRACGDGIKTRAVRCRDTMDTDSDALGKITGDFMCTDQKASPTANCNEKACPEYIFQTGAWSKCSKECGAGTRSRTVQCFDTVAGVAAAPKECTDRGLVKPSISRNCNIKGCGDCGTTGKEACAGVWQMTGFSSCTKLCGIGEQSRTVTCHAIADGTKINDRKCGGAKPTATVDCNGHACPSYQVGIWGACDAKCDNGISKRAVDCLDHAGNVVTNDQCSHVLSPPEATRACYDRSCGHWHRNPWGECDQLCATAKSGGTPGSQVRTLTCRLPHNNEWKGVAVAPWDKADLCPSDAEEIPATTQACNIEACGTYYWDFAAWSACDKTCGGGTQSTTAVCKSSATGAAHADDSVCGAKPAVSRACNSNLCSTYEWGYGNSAATTAESAWGACDASCGEGTQARAVECRDTTGVKLLGYVVPYEVVAESMCGSAGAKPATKRACGAVVANECGTNGKCLNKKCSCDLGFGGAKCGTTPTITNVEVRLDGIHDNVAHGDVVSIRWASTGDLKDVDILLLLSGSTYPITLTTAARAKNTAAADRVFLWHLPAADSSAAMAIGAGDYSIVVQFSPAIKGASSAFKVESPCFVTNCGPNGSCSAIGGKCTCTNGFTGASCSISPCVAKMCGVHSTCKLDATVPAGAKCMCADGWKGDTCVTPDAPCKNAAPCKNGGVRRSTGIEIDGVASCGECACKQGTQWSGATCATCGLTCKNKGKVNSECSKCECGTKWGGRYGYFGDRCSCKYTRWITRVRVRGMTSAQLLKNPTKLKAWWTAYLADMSKYLKKRRWKGTVVRANRPDDIKTSGRTRVRVIFHVNAECLTTAVGCAAGPSGGFFETMALAAGEGPQTYSLEMANTDLLAQFSDPLSELRTTGVVTSDFDDTFPPELQNAETGDTGDTDGPSSQASPEAPASPAKESEFPLTIVLIVGCVGLALIVVIVVGAVVITKRNKAARGLGGQATTFELPESTVVPSPGGSRPISTVQMGAVNPMHNSDSFKTSSTDKGKERGTSLL